MGSFRSLLLPPPHRHAVAENDVLVTLGSALLLVFCFFASHEGSWTYVRVSGIRGSGTYKVVFSGEKEWRSSWGETPLPAYPWAEEKESGLRD